MSKVTYMKHLKEVYILFVWEAFMWVDGENEGGDGGSDPKKRGGGYRG